MVLATQQNPCPRDKVSHYHSSVGSLLVLYKIMILLCENRVIFYELSIAKIKGRNARRRNILSDTLNNRS